MQICHQKQAFSRFDYFIDIELKILPFLYQTCACCVMFILFLFIFSLWMIAKNKMLALHCVFHYLFYCMPCELKSISFNIILNVA